MQRAHRQRPRAGESMGVRDIPSSPNETGWTELGGSMEEEVRDMKRGP